MDSGMNGMDLQRTVPGTCKVQFKYSDNLWTSSNSCVYLSNI